MSSTRYTTRAQRGARSRRQMRVHARDYSQATGWLYIRNRVILIASILAILTIWVIGMAPAYAWDLLVGVLAWTIALAIAVCVAISLFSHYQLGQLELVPVEIAEEPVTDPVLDRVDEPAPAPKPATQKPEPVVQETPEVKEEIIEGEFQEVVS